MVDPLRAAGSRLPAAPTFGRALRTALTDFYFNSWRLVPANVIWGVGLVALYVVWLISPIGAVLLAPLLAFPTLGIFRVAALIVRGEPASFWDALRAWRREFVPTLLAGAAAVASTLVLGTNVAVGILSAGVVGWAVATLAAWGLIVAAIAAVCFWPLLVDPARSGEPARSRARLAGLLVVAFPVRLGALAAILGVVLVASTVAFAALVTVSIAYCALVACRYVLPAADRLEARLARTSRPPA